MKAKCPKCKSPLPSYLVDTREAGGKGGRATGPQKARSTEQASRAARARWEKVAAEKNKKPLDGITSRT